MASERKVDGGIQSKDPLQDVFSQNANVPAPVQKEHGFAASVAAEAAMNRDKNMALDRHEFRWKIHRDRIANQTEIAPSLGPDGHSDRSLVREYQEMRSRWEVQRDAIVQDFDDKITDHRSANQTLSAHFQEAETITSDHQAEMTTPSMDFNAAANNQIGIVPEPAIEPTSEPVIEPAPEPQSAEIETRETVSVTREFSCSVQTHERSL